MRSDDAPGRLISQMREPLRIHGATIQDQLPQRGQTGFREEGARSRHGQGGSERGDKASHTDKKPGHMACGAAQVPPRWYLSG
jgi:hypothetical protein